MSSRNLEPLPEDTVVAQIYQKRVPFRTVEYSVYGALGAQGRTADQWLHCGRIMNNVADDVPWWRVVAKDGSLPISKRNPQLGHTATGELEDEGVEFDDKGRVKMEVFSVS
jgi:alkylated DNA nucleotide flippase Atl1